MPKAKIAKTLEDAREQLLAVLPMGFTIITSVEYRDSCDGKCTRASSRYKAWFYADEDYQNNVDVEAPTAQQLVKNTIVALTQFCKRKALTASRPQPHVETPRVLSVNTRVLRLLDQ